MLLLNIEDNSRVPKYKQILDQIREKIESRALLPLREASFYPPPGR